ncbi:hypothetical protein [Liquorilactobacillus sp.]|uniref:hypothetical protein n=1 Tax=Liquorilactobacillus sp. TaxID=2767923 RepID=UPI0039EAD025
MYRGITKKSIGLLMCFLLMGLALSACGERSKLHTGTQGEGRISNDKSMKLFSQALHSSTPTIWFPVSTGDGYNEKGAQLSTRFKIPQIAVLKNGKAIFYTAVTWNSALVTGKYAMQHKDDFKDYSLTLGEISKLSTDEVIKKYKGLDKKVYNYYKNTLTNKMILEAKQEQEDILANWSMPAGKELEKTTYDKYADTVYSAIRRSASKSYQAPTSHSVQSFIATDSSGNKTAKERIWFDSTLWGTKKVISDNMSLIKDLNISNRKFDGMDVAMYVNVNYRTMLRSSGQYFDITPNSQQVKQIIYKNKYYGYYGSNNDYLITPKETFKRIGTSNTTLRLDNPTDKGIKKLQIFK